VESPIPQFLYKLLVCAGWGGGESTHYIPETKQKSEGENDGPAHFSN